MANGWHFGNAAIDGAGDRGWILGHFFPDRNDVRSSDAVEVKWGVHPAGESRETWVTGEKRTTMVVLIKGRFQVDLSEASHELNTEGDYVVWSIGIDHCWRAIEDSVVLTVRWPSLS